MKPNEYSWNEYEQNAFLASKHEALSKRKIAIDDVDEKRGELVEILDQLPHDKIARWALENAQKYIPYIDATDDAEQIINEASYALSQRIAGNISVSELRRAGFLANTLAQRSTNVISKFSARVFAQAIATGHMRSHAIVSADYAIRVVNELYPNDTKQVINERNRQINLAKEYYKLSWNEPTPPPARTN